jgi:molybdopterin synthase catalytic subunit
MKDRIGVGFESLENTKLPSEWKNGAFGSVLEFRGCVRNTNEGKEVEAIEYEAHHTLAVKSLDEIRANLLKEFSDIVDILIFHRTGRLLLGETSLLIGVASPHRKNAFAVCQKIIDEIKRSTPIWKHECYSTNEKAWLAGTSLNTEKTS